MKTTVIHHSADHDGIFCREIARKFLPDAELIGWDFGDPLIPMPAEGNLYILDLSPDCLAETSTDNIDRIIWIDHHKSSIEKWAKTMVGYRIDGVAACRLAWQWFDYHAKGLDGHRNQLDPNLPTKQEFVDRTVIEPWAVRLAGEYDIWDKRDPDAELFQHGLRSQELGENMWDILLSGPTQFKDGQGGLAEVTVNTLLDAGRALQYTKAQENASIIKDLGFTFQWEGLTWLACNHARYNSHLFTAALRREHDACFGFKFTGHVAGGKPSEEWAISLYHAPGKEHHDLSQIAVKYGGGGHRGACGFRASKLPFLP